KIKSKVTKDTSVAFVMHRNEYGIHQRANPNRNFPNPPKPTGDRPAAMVLKKRAPFLTRRVYTQQLIRSFAKSYETHTKHFSKRIRILIAYNYATR
ncbi:hypothetical protein, partial [Bacillus sp. AS_3]|uniref:hypothetical protein n=1 Tax=Bacillus sp. AS_3 TaxID=2993439 RepID=UPI002AA2AE92